MSRGATVYTHGHHDSVLRSHRWRTAANSAAYLLPYLRGGQSLLDVGSGPGTITADLAEAVDPGRVTAVEHTAQALDLTRREAVRRSRTNIDDVVSNAEGLDLPDDTFDIVHAHQVLQHVGDPVAALREMRRVCKPGGVVAVRDSDYSAFVWYPQLPGLEEWLDLYLTVARANGGEPDAGRRLLAWAHEAGFDDVTPTASTWCFATPEDRDWWGGLWADRVLQSQMATRAVESGVATTTDLQRISTAWRSWAEHPDGWMALPHGELICRP